MDISDKLAPKKPVNKLSGNYIVTRPEGTYHAILKARPNVNKEFKVVIPNAGFDREFVFLLVALLNSQDSGEVREATGGEKE